MINFLKLWNKSGKQYQEYALKFPQYKKTNQRIVEIADIKANQIVVDLACGTGLTTKEVLKNYPDVKKIYAFDFSKDMIDIAKEFVQSKKVIFIVADAQDLDKFISEKVDVVLCNSAFWQFQNQNKVLYVISNILKDNGKIIFNLNQQFFDFGKSEPNQKILIETIFSEMKKGVTSPATKLNQKLIRIKLKNYFLTQDIFLKRLKS